MAKQKIIWLFKQSKRLKVIKIFLFHISIPSLMQRPFSTNFQNSNSNSITFGNSDSSNYQASNKSLSNQEKYLLLLQNVLLDDQDQSTSLLDLSYNMSDSFESFQMNYITSTPKKTLSSVSSSKRRTRDIPNSLNSSRINDSVNHMGNMWNYLSIKSTNNSYEEIQFFPSMKDLR